ncbi:PREDICTED: uncharacterized protein DDB_G0284459-like [Branchiostoma belcheri]|uniref:Uncharacterized protein DDB_G0284459-like n=1 Tax=Branchiostoma belcheri TaxID=7741 RepID=A0A6P5AHG5_BRABE|nr:PREDICTED: uncharacterized protein DDB_G0284459-like [Branchiostoma belcheri]
MHLTFPKRKGYYTWEELRCLARALGYQVDVFERVIPDFAEGEAGVSFRQVSRLMELNFFNEAFHLTYNLHTAHYNCQLIKKCLVLLDHRFLNFQEIHEIRVAYVAYEHHDMHGMIINEKALLRTLKMCGRTVAPLKLMHRVKHLKENYEAKGRIQIYEFMDLLILCKMWDDVNVKDTRVKGPDKNWRRLYQMDKVKEVFHTYDEKVFELLNKEFEATELNYGDVSFGDRKQFRENPVDKEKNTEQFKTHTTTYKRLQKIIDSTTQQVIQARAHGIAKNKDRPTSASQLDEQLIESSPERDQSPSGLGRRASDKGVERGNQNNQYHDRSKRMSAISARSSVSYASGSRGHIARSLGRKSRATTATSRRQSSVGKITESDWTLVVPVPKLKTPDYKRPKTATLVTRDDLERQNDELKKLQYNLETLEVKTKVHLDEDIDIALGKGFRIRSAKRKAEAERNRPPEPKPPRPPRSPVPSPESLRRLSSPRPRTPKGHSNLCDAVKLGIAPTDDSRSEKSGKKGRKKKKKKSGKKKTKGHQFSFTVGRSRMMSAWDDDETSTDTEDASTFSSVTEDRVPTQGEKPSILKDILYGVDGEEIVDDDVQESYRSVSGSTPVTPSSEFTEHDRTVVTPPEFPPKPPPPPPPPTSVSSAVKNKPREKKVHEPKRKVDSPGKGLGQRQLSTILESTLQREEEETGSDEEDSDKRMWKEWMKYEQGEDDMTEEEEEEDERVEETKKGSRRSSRVRSVSIVTEEQGEDEDFWKDITSETVVQAVVKNIKMEEAAVEQKFSPSLTRLEKLQMEYHARTRPAKPTIVQARRLVGRVREEASKGLKRALLRPLS